MTGRIVDDTHQVPAARGVWGPRSSSHMRRTGTRTFAPARGELAGKEEERGYGVRAKVSLRQYVAPEMVGSDKLDFGHSGIDPLQTRQEWAGAVGKLGKV